MDSCMHAHACTRKHTCKHVVCTHTHTHMYALSHFPQLAPSDPSLSCRTAVPRPLLPLLRWLVITKVSHHILGQLTWKNRRKEGSDFCLFGAVSSGGAGVGPRGSGWGIFIYSMYEVCSCVEARGQPECIRPGPSDNLLAHCSLVPGTYSTLRFRLRAERTCCAMFSHRLVFPATALRCGRLYSCSTARKTGSGRGHPALCRALSEYMTA